MENIHERWSWKIETGGTSHRHATVNKWVPFGRSLHLGGGLMMTVSKARKPYVCEWCHKPIEVGEQYARFRYVRECDGVPAGATCQRHALCMTNGLTFTTQHRDDGF